MRRAKSASYLFRTVSSPHHRCSRWLLDIVGDDSPSRTVHSTSTDSSVSFSAQTPDLCYDLSDIQVARLQRRTTFPAPRLLYTGLPTTIITRHRCNPTSSYTDSSTIVTWLISDAEAARLFSSLDDAFDIQYLEVAHFRSSLSRSNHSFHSHSRTKGIAIAGFRRSLGVLQY